eukprot:CAMPEP_0201516366 /NCGR_PEP_ID=MMETSP0161_2-20130828/7712_1 /ASSEMBLY_ACC=CAM_ASM_000251 /TAXON_ID=180227 /ORGANISM="Neoparamoeba aestuarina, Strain SoJaBio B1-5/56/2" /LENGTH=196 /DNA_ID=CAMNT_0047913469 /DNA_START=47 /DNA_END=637 /DNA_ORIENTATION=+
MKLNFPATQRNKEAILEVLKVVLPPSGTVVEVASGSGQHAVHFARHLPSLTWQTSDFNHEYLASQRAFREEEGLSNLVEPVFLDVTSSDWPIKTADAVFNANLIHISPWNACLGLLDGASRLLSPGAPLVFYGPFLVGEKTAPSNLNFSEGLKQQNPEWGVRSLDTVTTEASKRGFELDKVVDMPANNLIVVYKKQ